MNQKEVLDGIIELAKATGANKALLYVCRVLEHEGVSSEVLIEVMSIEPEDVLSGQQYVPREERKVDPLVVSKRLSES